MTVDSDHLEIAISDGLESIAFSAGGIDLGALTQPRLLWECSCRREEGGQSPRNGPCRLHALHGSSRIAMLFGHDTRLSYRGLRICWDGHRCWPPSIDSFYLAKTLIEEGWPRRAHRRLWDIGAATGFLGLQLCNASHWIEELIAVEPNATAVYECKRNYDLNATTLRARAHTLECALNDLRMDRFHDGDAVVSNPPYLPRAPWQQAISDVANPVVGTSVLEGLVRLAATRRVEVAMCYSRLAEPEFQAARRLAPRLNVRTLAERELPLRVCLDERYVEWLTNDRGLTVRRKDVFAYSHEIRIVVLGVKDNKSD